MNRLVPTDRTNTPKTCTRLVQYGMVQPFGLGHELNRMNGELFETVVVPIANPSGTEGTARAIQHYKTPKSEIIVTHVVEKAGGALTRWPSNSGNSTPKRPTRRSSTCCPSSGGTFDFRPCMAETSLPPSSTVRRTRTRQSSRSHLVAEVDGRDSSPRI